MNQFSLDHLDDTEFEEFCHDLLNAKGFQEINWRKGTGLNSSPSDSGRDIECKLEKVDIDRNKFFETWFVECKHYKKGVPPNKLEGILAWASAENPDVVLIVASNFLSNPSKDYLEKYKQNNKPKFRIKIWEKPELERLSSGESRLLKKYNISGEFPFVNILHPVHLLYFKQLNMNSLDYFFEVIDELESKKRDAILSWAYHLIIRPRFRESITGKETLKELMIDEVSYSAFKMKCYEIVKSDWLSEEALIFLIVNFTLQMMFAVSDTTSVDEFRYRMRDAVFFFQERREKEPEDIDQLDKLIKFTEKSITNAQERIENNFKEYEYFCEKVVQNLLIEDIRY